MVNCVLVGLGGHYVFVSLGGARGGGGGFEIGRRLSFLRRRCGDEAGRGSRAALRSFVDFWGGDTVQSVVEQLPTLTLLSALYQPGAIDSEVTVGHVRVHECVCHWQSHKKVSYEVTA